MQCIVTDVGGVSLCVTSAPNDPGSALLCQVIGGGACHMHCVSCAWSHSVQPLPISFGILLNTVGVY